MRAEESFIPSERYLDLLRETANLGAGHAAAVLNDMLGRKLGLTVPRAFIGHLSEASARLAEWRPGGFSAAVASLSGGVFSRAAVLFPRDGAERLVAYLAARPANSSDIEALRPGVLREAGNIILNGFLTALTSFLSVRHGSTVPYHTAVPGDNSLGIFPLPPGALFVVLESRFALDGRGSGGDFAVTFLVENTSGFFSLLRSSRKSEPLP